MPAYLYKCTECGHVYEIEYGMLESKPSWIGHCLLCPIGVLKRKFTIPGLFVADVDEWVVRVPGEVSRERRDMKWRRKYRPEIYEEER